MPQVIIMLIIWISSTRVFVCSPINGHDPLFKTTFVTSVTAASFGISKFLKSGPCRIIKSDKYCMGFGTMSYILLLINIAATVVVKGFTCAAVIGIYPPSEGIYKIPVVLVLYLPQLVVVSSDSKVTNQTLPRSSLFITIYKR